METKKNIVALKVSQSLPAYTTTGGNIVEAFENDVVFTSGSVQELSADNIAAWCLEQIEHWLSIQRLQNKKGFKFNKEVTFELTINGKTKMFGLKLSLNIDRLTSLLQRTPLLLGKIFTPTRNVKDASTDKLIAQWKATPSKMILAKHTKAEALEFEMLPNAGANEQPADL